MQTFGQLLADSIHSRIRSGITIYDLPAAPLKPGKNGRRGYPDFKSRRGIEPVRNWMWTGHTLSCLKVLTVSQNQAKLGFLNEAAPGRPQTASQIAFYNNRRDRQWGLSTRDRQGVAVVMINYRPLVTIAELKQGTWAKGMRQIGFAQYMNALPKAA